MLFEKKNKKIYFVHIPRTGGRFVHNLFEHNNFLVNLSNDFPYKNYEFMHLHHELLCNFNFYKNNKKFTIVRNPLDRFMSFAKFDMYRNNKGHTFRLKTKEDVLDYIELCSKAHFRYSNWLRPQSEFVSKDCKIWKFEDGLKDNFLQFLKINFDIKLDYVESLWEEVNILHEDLKNIDPIKKAVELIYNKDYKNFY
tara:strand:- start:435 stop:1022 length:588 start_codon:yes stop_codon:yes gene_type:complete